MLRGAGVLLHVASLPGGCYVGDFGPEAYRFIDQLGEAGQTYWQILPINHANPDGENSPYSPLTSFGGDPIFISLEKMARDGLLNSAPQCPSTDYIDYAKARFIKKTALEKAYKRGRSDKNFKIFKESTPWLEDYAYYMAMREKYGPWPQWPSDKKPDEGAVDFYKFVQYVFWSQWRELKQYANDNGVFIIGDLPIYLNIDSVDVWRHRKYFKVAQDGAPLYFGGVPPDYFSPTGQLWKMPVYNWEELERDGFRWWLERLRHSLAAFDYVRLDHFRGYVAYWEVPAHEETAAGGRWAPGPGKKLFQHVDPSRLIVEDLGYITPDVEELRDWLGVPGMRVLQFAWDGNPANPHKPHNYVKNLVVYTGTHDNNTAVGWFYTEATPKARREFLEYAMCREEVNWCFVRLLYMSVADVAIVPAQDILGLGPEARMNKPGSTGGNWKWRLAKPIPQPYWKKLKKFAKLYGRL
ncbi:MAG: 4-alpha-glucanotransferase [Pyrobaculum sp.]